MGIACSATVFQCGSLISWPIGPYLSVAWPYFSQFKEAKTRLEATPTFAVEQCTKWKTKLPGFDMSLVSEGFAFECTNKNNKAIISSVYSQSQKATDSHFQVNT